MTITKADLASDAGLPAPSKPKKLTKKQKRAGADRALVASVKIELRELITRTLDKGIDEVGDLLLARFFDGKAERYGGDNPENPSLDLLLDECGKSGLHVSRTFLGNALRLAVFRTRLGKESAFQKLDPSHRIELLCLGDAEDSDTRDDVEMFAAESLAHDYSVRQLRQEVEVFRGLPERRKAVGPALDTCMRNLTNHETGELLFTSKDFAGVTAEQLDHVEVQALALKRHAEALVALAQARRAQLATEAPPEAAEPKAIAKEAPPEKEKPAEPLASKPAAKEPSPTAKAGSKGKTVTPAAPSRRRDDAKASRSSAKTKAEKGAAAAETASENDAEARKASPASKTTTAATGKKADAEPGARKTAK